MRRILALLIVFAFVVAACGDDSADVGDDTADDTTGDTTDDTTADDTTGDTADDTTDDAADDMTDDAADDAADDMAGGGNIAVVLTEWEIQTGAELVAGSYTFELSNVGQFPHTFGISRGTSYADLPQLDNGAVDEAALGTDFLGSSEFVDSGATASIEFELEPGNYVFFCNINIGPNSHAANGQTLSVTVT